VWCGVAATAALGIATATSGVFALKDRSRYKDALHAGSQATSDLWQLREDALSAEHRTTTLGLVTLLAASTTLTVYAFSVPAGGTQVRTSLGPFGAKAEGAF
jgi:hypothetical protein